MSFLDDVQAAWKGLKTCVYRSNGHKCVICGKPLETAYLENRLYAIRCPSCKTVTLREARSSLEAEEAISTTIEEVMGK